MNFSLKQCEVLDEENKELTRFLESDHLKKHHPESYALQKLPWLITGSLTWSDSGRRFKSDRAKQFRNYDFNLLLIKTADRIKNRLKHVAIVSADEHHVSGELHRHFLIGNYGLKNVEADTLATIMTNLWQRELHPFDCSLEGMGTAQIEPYNYKDFWLAGVNYFCKRQYDLDRREYDKVFQYSDGFWKMVKNNDPTLFNETIANMKRNFKSATDANGTDVSNDVSFKIGILPDCSQPEDEISLAF
jgi:hypothetical protein